MSCQTPVVAVALLALTITDGRAWGQENPPTPAAPSAHPAQAKDASKPEPAAERAAARSPELRNAATAMLRVQLVIARFQNERKQASLPYTFVVAALPNMNGDKRIRMRMGVDTPVPTVTYDDKKQPIATVQYRNVGTNIDCWATDLGDGRYQLNLTVENSSALSASSSRPGSTGDAATTRSDLASAAPLFRRFDSSLSPILRDGQTVQTVASTDPVTGEVVKIDVTMNVLK